MKELDKDKLKKLADESRSWPDYRHAEMGTNAPDRIAPTPILHNLILTRDALRKDLAAANSRIVDLGLRLAEAERDSARLSWLDQNPHRVIASIGYLNEADAWCWRDCTAERTIHVAGSLRAAVDEAREAK